MGERTWNVVSEKHIFIIIKQFFIKKMAQHRLTCCYWCRTFLKVLLKAGYEQEDFSDYEVTNSLTSINIATIFDQEMENRNYHRFTNLFSSIRSGIWAILPGIPDSRISHALCKIFNKLFSEEEEIIGC